jgi:hypothetical protein
LPVSGRLNVKKPTGAAEVKNAASGFTMSPTGRV